VTAPVVALPIFTMLRILQRGGISGGKMLLFAGCQ
jgi:hypothetical protein